MKTFRQLKKQLIESGEHTTGGGFGDVFVHTNANSAIKDYGSGTFELSQDGNINRVNAFLDSYFRSPCTEYQTKLGMLKSKLNIIGLDFPYNKNTELREGMNRFELTRFGGTFGKTPQTPFDEFETTNGFPEGESYSLVIDVNSGESGKYQIHARVVREAESGGEPTDE